MSSTWKYVHDRRVLTRDAIRLFLCRAPKAGLTLSMAEQVLIPWTLPEDLNAEITEFEDPQPVPKP